MKGLFKIVCVVLLLGILLTSGLVTAKRSRQIKRVYVHVCDKYPAHIKVEDGKITKLHPITEVLPVLDPKIPGNADINRETVWIFVDSWRAEDFEFVPWIAVSIWRYLHQPPILAFNIDAACYYTEIDRHSECWFHSWELGYRRMRDLAIRWEKYRCWPEWKDIPAEIQKVIQNE